jgi:sulfate/thiosulfate transport system ATP-binding protein
MSIEVDGIRKIFSKHTALDGVSLSFPPGQLTALLGPSGCGKTTLLRIIAGLENADAGTVYLDGEDATNIHVRDRRIGFVFQHYALFKHMSVADNIAFGLRVKPRKYRPSEDQIGRKVRQLLELVQLEHLGGRHPSQLSGGQRQRIALARALAIEPRVLLLDEPFGALDAKVRKDLRGWIRRLHDELHFTSIFVTHDQDEALEIADQVVLMNQGRIEQIGKPDEVYSSPASAFAYEFLGDVNRIEGRLLNGEFHTGNAVLAAGTYGSYSDSNAVAYVRPHEFEIGPDDGTAGSINATLIRKRIVGSTVHAEVRRRDTDDYLDIMVPRERFDGLLLNPGDRIAVMPNRFRIFTGMDASSKQQATQ